MGKKRRCEWVTKIEKKPQGRFSIPALLPKTISPLRCLAKTSIFVADFHVIPTNDIHEAKRRPRLFLPFFFFSSSNTAFFSIPVLNS